MSEDTVITHVPFELDAGFVGREAQMRTLAKTFESAAELRALQCACVVGGPGMGKSRIVKELGRRARHKLPSTRIYFGQPSSGREPYSAITQLMLNRLGLPRGATTEDRRTALESHVERAFGGARSREVCHYLCRLLGLPIDSDDETVTEQKLDTRMFLALRDFFAADSDRSPLILCIERMEQASPETINLLRYLRAGLRPYPVVLVLTCTEELFERYPQIGDGETPLLRVDLPPLPESERAALFRRLCRQLDALPVELSTHAISMGESPRLIYDLVRLLLESEIIVPSGSLSWRVDERRLRRLPLPHSFDELVTSRLRVIDPIHRSVLEKASVLGESFWLDALLALDRSLTLLGDDPDGPPLEMIVDEGDLSRSTLTTALTRLCDSEWIVPSGEAMLRGQTEYTFTSGDLREQVKRAVNPGTARVYSQAAAHWLELRPEGREPHSQEIIADYLKAAGDAPAAASHYRRAADSARRSFYNAKAIDMYRLALDCLGPSDLTSRIHIWHDLGSVYELSGSYEESLDAYERMLRLSWLLAARSKAAVAFNKIGRIWRQKGDLKAALEYLARAEKLFQQTGDQRGIAGSLDDIGQVLFLAGRYAEAQERAALALQMRRAEGDPRSIASSLETVGKIQMQTGRWDESRRHHREALDLRNEYGDQPGIARSMHYIARIDFERGDTRSAIADWQYGLNIARDIGAPRLQAKLLIDLGRAARLLNRVEDARGRLQEATSLAQQSDDIPLTAACHIELALATKESSQAELAKDLARDAFSMALATGRKRLIAMAHVAFAEVAGANLYDSDQTFVGAEGLAFPEQRFTKGINMLREIGHEFELAVSLEAFGRYRLERNSISDGVELIKEALAIFRKLRCYRAAGASKVLQAAGVAH